MSPLVSIIIPTYNRADLICETIDSVIMQTYVEWECIIIDDGSTDNTSEIINDYIKKDFRIKYYHRPVKKNKGPSSCRNVGIEKANGAFIVFLDSDDLFTRECLENRVKFAQHNFEYDLWVFKTKVFDKNPADKNVIFNTKLEEYSDKLYLKLFFEGLHPFHVSSLLWRTEKIREISGFDEKLIVAEDPDLHIRAFLHGLKSITSNSLDYNSLYRIDFQSRLKSQNDKKSIKKRDNSLYIIFQKFLKSNKESIKYYSLKFFKDELLFNGSSYNIMRFYFLYVRYNIYNTKQLFLIPVLLGYKVFGLDSVKGMGFYTLKKQLF